MRTNKVTITGFIIGIIVLSYNIGVNIFYVIISFRITEIIDDIKGIEVIQEYKIGDSVLIAFIFISFLTLVGFIVCFIFALRGKIGARIAGALLMIALMFFTWIWIFGPIFCLITGLIIFNGHERVTDITLIEAHNLRQLKKQEKHKKS